MAGAIFFPDLANTSLQRGACVVPLIAGSNCAEDSARYSDRMNKTLFDQAGQFILPE
jgi:hypothetical protein